MATNNGQPGFSSACPQYENYVLDKIPNASEVANEPPQCIIDIEPPNPNMNDDKELLEPSKNMAFSEDSIRKAFIRKVYLILMTQLSFTCGIIAWFVFHQPTMEFLKKNYYIFIIAAIIAIIMVFATSCFENLRRQFPGNFICLAIFTIAESILVGAIAGFYKKDVVLIAFGITAILCLALMTFAIQTKIDFTGCGAFLFLALVCLLIFGIVGIFWSSYILRTVYASCGALLACCFLIYDTQLMMGGEHKYNISPEEYIFAALCLYIDIIRIFIYILRLLGNRG